MRSKQRHYMDRSLLRASRLVVAVSRFSGDRLLERGYVESGEKVRVIHNGVGEEWFEVESRPESPESSVTAVFVGRLDEQKGVDVLLRALARVRDLVLHVVGEGIRAPEYRSLARDLGIQERVRFHGRLEPAAIRSLMVDAQLSVLPSRAESFGLVALEAMAAGLPVVVSRVGGLPEFVDHEETGWLVSPGSVEELAGALARLAGDPGLRGRLGREARARARDLSWDRVVRRYAEAYRTVRESSR